MQRLNMEEAPPTGDHVRRRRGGSRRMGGMPTLRIGPQPVLQALAVVPPRLGDLAVKVCEEVLVAGDGSSIQEAGRYRPRAARISSGFLERAHARFDTDVVLPEWV